MPRLGFVGCSVVDESEREAQPAYEGMGAVALVARTVRLRPWVLAVSSAWSATATTSSKVSASTDDARPKLTVNAGTRPVVSVSASRSRRRSSTLVAVGVSQSGRTMTNSSPP